MVPPTETTPPVAVPPVTAVTEPSEPDAGWSVDVPPVTVVTPPLPPDEPAAVSEEDPPVIVVTGEGSPEEDPGVPVTAVTGKGSAGVVVGWCRPGPRRSIRAITTRAMKNPACPRPRGCPWPGRP